MLFRNSYFSSKLDIVLEYKLSRSDTCFLTESLSSYVCDPYDAQSWRILRRYPSITANCKNIVKLLYLPFSTHDPYGMIVWSSLDS